MEYVYLVKCQQFHKIGITKNMENRFVNMQTGNPFPLSVVSSYIFEKAEPIEWKLHRHFALYLERGEWFWLSNSDLESFEDICKKLGGVKNEKTYHPRKAYPISEYLNARIEQLRELGI